MVTFWFMPNFLAQKATVSGAAGAHGSFGGKEVERGVPGSLGESGNKRGSLRGKKVRSDYMLPFGCMVVRDDLTRFALSPSSQDAISCLHTLTHYCLHSFVLAKKPTTVLSAHCALFGEKTPGWGLSPLMRSDCNQLCYRATYDGTTMTQQPRSSLMLPYHSAGFLSFPPR